MKQIDLLTAVEFKMRNPEPEYTLQTSQELYAAYGDTTYWALLRVQVAWRRLINTLMQTMQRVAFRFRRLIGRVRG